MNLQHSRHAYTVLVLLDLLSPVRRGSSTTECHSFRKTKNCGLQYFVISEMVHFGVHTLIMYNNIISIEWCVNAANI
jgi:hypothetical protein